MPMVGAAIGAASAWFAATSVGVFIATPLGSLLMSTALTAASRALQRAQAGKQRPPGISTEYTTDGGTRPQSMVLGWYATAGHMVCPPMSHGKSGKRDNAYLTYVVNLGDVPGQQLKRIIIDDRVVEFAPEEASQPVGGAPPAGKPGWWYQQQNLSPTAPSAGLTIAAYGRPALDRHARQGLAALSRRPSGRGRSLSAAGLWREHALGSAFVAAVDG